LQRILRMMAPAILGNAAVLINVAVSTNLASAIADPVRGFDGPVSWLGYAFRFMQLPLGLFGVAIGSATLPSISRSAAAGNMDEFRRTFSKSLGMVFLLTLPSSVGLVVLGKSIIGSIYQGGKFEVYDTQQTATALSCYAIGLVGYAGLKVLSPAFYALNDARTPMIVSILSILINYATAVTLTRVAGFGHAGLALATSAVALFGFLVLFAILRAKIGGAYGRELVSGFAKVALASAAMGVVVFVASRQMGRWLGASQMAHRADLAVSLPLGVAVFYLACRATGVTDLDMVFQAVLGPVVRRLRRAGP
jgi:putative peptidoglycan lipid II flippase